MSDTNAALCSGGTLASEACCSNVHTGTKWLELCITQWTLSEHYFVQVTEGRNQDEVTPGRRAKTHVGKW